DMITVRELVALAQYVPQEARLIASNRHPATVGTAGQASVTGRRRRRPAGRLTLTGFGVPPSRSRRLQYGNQPSVVVAEYRGATAGRTTGSVIRNMVDGCEQRRRRCGTTDREHPHQVVLARRRESSPRPVKRQGIDTLGMRPGPFACRRVGDVPDLNVRA